MSTFLYMQEYIILKQLYVKLDPISIFFYNTGFDHFLSGWILPYNFSIIFGMPKESRPIAALQHIFGVG